MTYQYGQTINKPALAAKTADEVRAHLENLNRVRANIITETAAKERELARIRASRKRLQPVATYAPNPEQIAYYNEHAAEISRLPNKHGGYQGLHLAVAEAAAHDARKE